ncbi:MAG: glycosyltransferase [Thermoplasmata archaeon]|nr:glycosyltransferase [Thermoplasmata archaeon]
MEIAFFTESYLPTRDGVSAVVSGLARCLQRLGHQVRVFAPHPVVGASSETTSVDGVPVVHVRSLPVPVYHEYRWGLFPVAQLHGQHLRDIDVIHLHTPGVVGSTGFLASRYYRKPVIGTFHTNVWEMRRSFGGGPLAWLFFQSAWRWTLGTYWRCDLTTAPTIAARDALLEHASKPFHRPIEVVPNGIDLEEFRPGLTVPDWRERCGLGDGPMVTYLGRLTEDKGIHRFLDAVGDAAAQRPVVGIVGGSGPEEAEVRRRLRTEPRLAQRVRYVGPVAEAEKAALLGQSDLFVLPSTSDTSSIALLEAMACGTPVLASSLGGPAEIVEQGRTGVKVDPRDRPALVGAMIELLDDATRRRQLGRNGVDFVRAHASIEATARRFISLYELLLTERPGRAPRHVG